MAVVDVGVAINAIDNATGTINRVRGAIGGLSGSGRGGLGGLSSGFGGANRSAFGFLSRMNTVAASAFVVYQTIRSVVVGLAQFAAESQRASQSLIVTTGSIDAATAQFGRMVQTFTPAGFAIENMVQNFNALRGAGLGVADANRTLEATAAAVSAFGGSQQQMDRAAMALSQIGAKGVAAMEELRGQLSEAVPIALAIMADRAGTSIAAFMARVKQGLVSSEEAIRLFTEGAEELFDGLLEAQRQTLTGAVNEMTSAMQVGLADLFTRTNLDERLVVTIHEVTEGILGFFASIDQETIDGFFEGLAKLEEVMISVGSVANALGPIFDLLGGFIGPIATVVLDVLSALGEFVAFCVNGAIWTVLKLAEAFARLAGDANAAAAISDAAESVGARIEQNAARLGSMTPGGARDGGLSRREMLEQLSARTRLEDSAQRIIELQRRQAEYNRNATTQTREQARLQERIRDLVAETNAQFQGSLLSFADNMDRVANRVADIFNMESLTYNVRQASADAVAGMTADQIRQAEVQRAMAQGMSGQLAQIQGNAVATFTRAAAAFRTEMEDALDNIQIAQADAFRELTGGNVEAAVLRVTLEYRRQARELQEALDKATQLNERTGTEGAIIREINGLLEESNRLRGIAVERARALEQASIAAAIAEHRNNASRALLDARQTDRANSNNPFMQMANGAAGGLIERVEDERQRLQQSISELVNQVAVARANAAAATGEMQSSLNATADALEENLQSQQRALAGMSENALLARELWQSVGETIKNSVGDAIYGVITGTETLEEVGQKMFQALLRAAIDYLIQLYAIAAAKQVIAMMGLANGGAVGGPIKKMADGGTAMQGIIRGPTMFMAGEAGEEAIMPLTRVNGKLGVRASGGRGGDNYNITIQSIDTQSGVEFLHKNMGSIVTGMRRKGMMNRGLGRTAP